MAVQHYLGRLWGSLFTVFGWIGHLLVKVQETHTLLQYFSVSTTPPSKMNPSLCKMYSLLSFYRRRSPGRWCAGGCTRSPPCSGPTPGGTTPAWSGHFGGAWGWQTRSKRSCPPSLPSISSRGGGMCYYPLRCNESSETDGSDKPNRGEPVNVDHRSG